MPGSVRSRDAFVLGERPAIVLLGDSLTQYGFGSGGWAARLAHQYQRRADVMNRGFSGYTTRWLAAAPSASSVPHARVLLTTIFLGSNDAAVKGDRHHVPLDEFQENLQARRGVDGCFFQNEEPPGAFVPLERTRPPRARRDRPALLVGTSRPSRGS